MWQIDFSMKVLQKFSGESINLSNDSRTAKQPNALKKKKKGKECQKEGREVAQP